MPRRSRHRMAFTLIELLVVIAIIALLIAILLPALKTARDQSRLVKCRTQLREYGVGFNFYLEDYNDTYPPHKHPGGPAGWGKAPYWFHLIDKYWLNVSDPEWYKRPLKKLGEAAFQLARCPDLQVMRDDMGNDWEWHYGRRDIGYGYNAFWLGYYSYTNADALAPGAVTVVWRREHEIRSPAECVLIGDSNPKPDGEWSSTLWWPLIAGAGEGVCTRHVETGKNVPSEYGGYISQYPDGFGNIIFADGHGEARRSGQINDLVEHRRFWDPEQNEGGY